MLFTRRSNSRQSVVKFRLGLEPLESRHLMCAVIAPLNLDSLFLSALSWKEPSLEPVPKSTSLVGVPRRGRAYRADLSRNRPPA